MPTRSKNARKDDEMGTTQKGTVLSHYKPITNDEKIPNRTNKRRNLLLASVSQNISGGTKKMPQGFKKHLWSSIYRSAYL